MPLEPKLDPCAGGAAPTWRPALRGPFGNGYVMDAPDLEGQLI